MVTDAFESVPDVERLDLSKNCVEYLPDSTTSLRKLEVLDLSRNPQLRVEDVANKLKNVTSLRWLNLSEVPLKSLESLKPLIKHKNESEHNETSVQLWGINLSSCELTISEDDVTFFDLMPSLIDIDLSHNHLSTLPPNIFRSLENLQSLKLASNVLINGVKLRIGEKQSLKLLDLSHNKLSNVETIHISGTVDEINLSENAVSEWNKKDVFLKSDSSNRTWVRRINLTHNAIAIISENMGSSLLHLESVDLGENPFDCDTCEVQTFQKWLRQHKNIRIFNLGTTNNLICGGTRRERTDVIYASFNNTSCLTRAAEEMFGPVVVIGVPLTVVLSLVLLTFIAMYGYRFEIAYVRHLISIRRQRHIRENDSLAHYKYDAFVSYR
jgi:hypothetical protein